MSLNLRYVTLCMTCHSIPCMLPCVWHVIRSQVCYPVYDMSLYLRWHRGHVQHEHTWTYPHQPAQRYIVNSVSKGVISLTLPLLNLLGFHREWLVEELLVEVLLDVVHQDAGDALVVELGSTRTTHHLQNIWNQNRTDHHILHSFSGMWTDLKSEDWQLEKKKKTAQTHSETMTGQNSLTWQSI